jgi:hypothetical protein
MTRRVAVASISTWVPVAADLPDRLQGAQDCLRRCSGEADPPWRYEGTGPDGEKLAGDRAFVEILSRPQVGAMMWRKRADGVEILAVNPGRGNFEDDRMLKAAVIPRDGLGEAFFCEVSIILGLRFAFLIPEFDHELSIQAWTLTSVLTKRFEKDRFEAFSRRIADRFPRVVDAAWTGHLLYPQRLGWLNYWPRPVCAWAGFPDPARDAGILPLCYQTDDGAWILKLTEEPLDLERDEHVEAIAWAYHRFDMIGRRPTPRAKGGKRKAGPGATASAVSPEQAREIALVAVGAYDINADDVEDAEGLQRMVKEELLAFGLDEEEVARVVAMLEAALTDTATDPHIARPAHSFLGDAIYVALVDAVRQLGGHE